MAIKNPIPPVVGKVKHVPKKVWIIALGGGVVLYLVFRSRQDASGDNADLQDPAVEDALSSPDPGTYPVSLGQGANGSLPAVDFGTPSPTVDGIDGVGAVDDAAGGMTDLGTLTLNIVGTPVDGKGADSTPGATTTANGSKAVSTKVVKTLADLPYATRKKIHDERVKGKVDRYGRTPTERAAARSNAGVRKQLDARLKRERAHKAGGGAPKRHHPKATHTQPKRSPKRTSPHSHVTQPKQSHPKATPHPNKKKKARSRA